MGVVRVAFQALRLKFHHQHKNSWAKFYQNLLIVAVVAMFSIQLSFQISRTRKLGTIVFAPFLTLAPASGGVASVVFTFVVFHLSHGEHAAFCSP